jgi:hypothetical protein
MAAHGCSECGAYGKHHNDCGVPVRIAIRRRDEALAEMQTEALSSPRYDAARREYCEMVTFLLERGA